MSQKLKPSLWWIVFALTLLLVGSCGGTGYWFWQMLRLDIVERFLVPATKEFRITEKGTYPLWYEYKTRFRGEIYDTSESLPDSRRIVFSDKDTDTEVDLETSATAHVQFMEHERSLIGQFRITHPGIYVLEVSGIDEPCVFALERGGSPRVWGATAVFMGLNAIAWLGGPVIIIVVLVKRSQNKRKLSAFRSGIVRG